MKNGFFIQLTEKQKRSIIQLAKEHKRSVNGYLLACVNFYERFYNSKNNVKLDFLNVSQNAAAKDIEFELLLNEFQRIGNQILDNKDLIECLKRVFPYKQFYMSDKNEIYIFNNKLLNLNLNDKETINVNQLNIWEDQKNQ